MSNRGVLCTVAAALLASHGAAAAAEPWPHASVVTRDVARAITFERDDKLDDALRLLSPLLDQHRVAASAELIVQRASFRLRKLSLTYRAGLASPALVFRLEPAGALAVSSRYHAMAHVVRTTTGNGEMDADLVIFGSDGAVLWRTRAWHARDPLLPVREPNADAVLSDLDFVVVSTGPHPETSFRWVGDTHCKWRVTIRARPAGCVSSQAGGVWSFVPELRLFVHRWAGRDGVDGVTVWPVDPDQAILSSPGLGR